jgi:hypothetical protein
LPLFRTFLVTLGLILTLPALSGRGPGHRPGPDHARREGRGARPRLRAQAPRPSFDIDDPSAPVILPNTEDDDDEDDDGAIGRASGGASGVAARAFARPTDPAGSPAGPSRRARRLQIRPVPVHFRC